MIGVPVSLIADSSEKGASSCMGVTLTGFDAKQRHKSALTRSLRNGREVYAMGDRISPEQGLGKDLRRSYFMLNAVMFLWELTKS